MDVSTESNGFRYAQANGVVWAIRKAYAPRDLDTYGDHWYCLSCAHDSEINNGAEWDRVERSEVYRHVRESTRYAGFPVTVGCYGCGHTIAQAGPGCDIG